MTKEQGSESSLRGGISEAKQSSSSNIRPEAQTVIRRAFAESSKSVPPKDKPTDSPGGGLKRGIGNSGN
jgi:hypothetical protein